MLRSLPEDEAKLLMEPGHRVPLTGQSTRQRGMAAIFLKQRSLHQRNMTPHTLYSKQRTIWHRFGGGYLKHLWNVDSQQVLLNINGLPWGIDASKSRIMDGRTEVHPYNGILFDNNELWIPSWKSLINIALGDKPPLHSDEMSRKNPNLWRQRELGFLGVGAEGQQYMRLRGIIGVLKMS